MIEAVVPQQASYRRLAHRSSVSCFESLVGKPVALVRRRPAITFHIPGEAESWVAGAVVNAGVFGVQGKQRLVGPALPTAFLLPRLPHSEKPAFFYHLIEAQSPRPYLELLARRLCRGWASWGNEIESTIQLAGPGDVGLFPARGCYVTCGPNASYFPNLVGKRVALLRRCLAGVFSIPDEAEPWVEGAVVSAGYRLRAGDSLEFLVRRGRKAVDDQPIPEAGPLLTVKEAATELHCSLSFVYKLMGTGQLAFERRGRRKLVLAASVAEYRKQNTHPATSRPIRPAKTPRRPYQFQRLFRDTPSGTGQ